MGTPEPEQPGRLLALNIRRLREKQGLSYRDLEARLRSYGKPILASGLFKLERADRRVDVDELVALAEVFGVSPVTLLMPAEPDQAAAWLARWRWMHGAAPLPGSEVDPEEFRRVNRPYEDPNPVKAASDRLTEVVLVLSSGNISLISFVVGDGTVWDLEKRERKSDGER